ncbi:AraC family ligand binding domain-containing protein [Cohnella ginsengisoli]|uniref:AraC family ligand binding domain-containing protein n=1 Tax=Cohnella ginsengisoli TaxID=425004 RepID=A0A9X4KK28_9BACL|nr:AraC family ligand binding domain-containing protein [Cohnella ginsengisoli]MDG0791702.1 AraC family ligand binding domain-containing protein [Cohnella ginsengisoli]
MLPLYLNEPYRLQMGGHFLSDETWSHMDRTIADYELIVGVSGVVFMETGGSMYEVRAGDVLFLMPGERHRGYRLSRPGVSFFIGSIFSFPKPGERRLRVRCRATRAARTRAGCIFWRVSCYMRPTAVTAFGGREITF